MQDTVYWVTNEGYLVRQIKWFKIMRKETL